MTDSEIIKALECCKYEYDTKCELCCYNVYSRTGCRSELRRNALDLINRLQAEIERLKAWENLLKAEKHSLIKSEAVKEFATKLKGGVPQETGVIRCSNINNLVKEMAGDTNA